MNISLLEEQARRELEFQLKSSSTTDPLKGSEMVLKTA